MVLARPPRCCHGRRGAAGDRPPGHAAGTAQMRSPLLRPSRLRRQPPGLHGHLAAPPIGNSISLCSVPRVLHRTRRGPQRQHASSPLRQRLSFAPYRRAAILPSSTLAPATWRSAAATATKSCTPPSRIHRCAALPAAPCQCSSLLTPAPSTSTAATTTCCSPGTAARFVFHRTDPSPPLAPTRVSAPDAIVCPSTSASSAAARTHTPTRRPPVAFLRRPILRHLRILHALLQHAARRHAPPPPGRLQPLSAHAAWNKLQHALHGNGLPLPTQPPGAPRPVPAPRPTSVVTAPRPNRAADTFLQQLAAIARHLAENGGARRCALSGCNKPVPFDVANLLGRNNFCCPHHAHMAHFTNRQDFVLTPTMRGCAKCGQRHLDRDCPRTNPDASEPAGPSAADAAAPPPGLCPLDHGLDAVTATPPAHPPALSPRGRPWLPPAGDAAPDALLSAEEDVEHHDAHIAQPYDNRTSDESDNALHPRQHAIHTTADKEWFTAAQKERSAALFQIDAFESRLRLARDHYQDLLRAFADQTEFIAVRNARDNACSPPSPPASPPASPRCSFHDPAHSFPFDLNDDLEVDYDIVHGTPSPLPPAWSPLNRLYCSIWHISHKAWNKAMHALHGNGFDISKIVLLVIIAALSYRLTVIGVHLLTACQRATDVFIRPAATAATTYSIIDAITRLVPTRAAPVHLAGRPHLRHPSTPPGDRHRPPRPRQACRSPPSAVGPWDLLPVASRPPLCPPHRW